jgi:hypothetical protein
MSKQAWIAMLVVIGALTALVLVSRSRVAPGIAGGVQIERLVPKEMLAGRTVAAVRVESPSTGASLLYLRAKGIWRCREVPGSVADTALVDALLASILEARGVEMSRDPARAAAYGLDDAHRLRVSLHGPKVLDKDGDGDTVLAFDIGTAFDDGARGRAFVRSKDGTAIVEIDRNPRALLEKPSGENLPPLLDTRLLAGSTGAGFVGFKQFFFDGADGQSFELVSDPPKKEGDMPEWFLVRDGKREAVLPWRVGGYESVWIRDHYDGLASTSRAKALGLDPPRMKITLVPSAGDPIEMLIGGVTPANLLHVWNKKTNAVYVLPGALAPLIAPEVNSFIDKDSPNPWEAWLRK